jgi:hypothetical protein
MKKINVIILFVMVFVLVVLPSTLATNYYVDNAVATSGNGLSWSTAWKNFANINWDILQPGDNVYISGGASSKTYNEGMEIYGIKGNAVNPISIVAGRYAPNPAGHNGRVIIRGSYNGNGVGFKVNGN